MVEFADLVPRPDVATMSPAEFFATAPFRHISVEGEVRDTTEILPKSRGGMVRPGRIPIDLLERPRQSAEPLKSRDSGFNEGAHYSIYLSSR